MSTNPFLNALAAIAYITMVASLMRYGSKAMPEVESVVIPIAILSLFVLSAAMMGYFFLCQPLKLLVGGKPEEATKFFLTTTASFAGIAGMIVSGWLFLNALA